MFGMARQICKTYLSEKLNADQGVNWGRQKRLFPLYVMFCIFFSYDDEAERITQYERIVLEDLEKIEIGECLNAPNLKISFCGKFLPFRFSKNIAFFFFHFFLAIVDLFCELH